jgi:hypothetical protein
VGPKINEQLALNPEQIQRARRFIVNMRARKPIAIVDAYYDHAGQALCPMATGISHHVSPKGSIEPCPIIQFATEDITDKRGLFETFTKSAFLADFRKTSAEHTRGCVVLERPDVVKQLVLKHHAKDTTVRQTAIAELDRMSPRPSQWMKEENIPEKHWMYWVAKRFFYTDFGVYKDLKA